MKPRKSILLSLEETFLESDNQEIFCEVFVTAKLHSGLMLPQKPLSDHVNVILQHFSACPGKRIGIAFRHNKEDFLCEKF
jgi:hypothetical protein